MAEEALNQQNTEEEINETGQEQDRQADATDELNPDNQENQEPDDEEQDNGEQEEQEDQEEEQIDEATKRQLIKNFFQFNKAKFPSFWEFNILVTYVSVALGLFFIFYFQPSIVTFILAVVSIATGFYFAIKWIEPYYREKQKYSFRPTAEQMEAWLVEDIKNIVKPAAKQLLSIPSSIPDVNYIIIPYPIYWENPVIPEDAILRWPVEDYYIYSAYKIQILVVAESFLSLYTCDYNWVENQILAPQSQEFFFEDISSINTGSEVLDYKIFDQRDQEEAETIGKVPTIIIRNKANEEMKLIIDIPSLMPSPKIRQNTIRIMQVLRILLRNRRAGEVFEE